jgi:tetratricopeptide (TPR) repeat protein
MVVKKKQQAASDTEFAAWLQDPDDGRTLAELSGYSAEDLAGLAEIGYNLLQQGKLEDALVIYQGVYSLDPLSQWGASSIGCIYQRMGRDEDALGMYNEALQIQPNDVHVLANRGELLFRRGRLLEAADDFKKSIELDPHGKNPAAQRARVIVLAVMELVDQAEAAGFDLNNLTPAQLEKARQGLQRSNARPGVAAGKR